MAADLQSVHQYWKSVNLESVQKKLDVTATELASRQDESDTSRKKLVDQSREFKKSTPEDIRIKVAPLLKSFQAEIDALSKRSKAGEAAFLSVYKMLIDMPDPQHCLGQAVTMQKVSHSASDLDMENQKLRETLREYNAEFAEVKNQEVTIKQLRAELKEAEKRVGYETQLRAQSYEKELHKQFTERQRELEEDKLQLAQRLGEAEQQITTLNKALSGTQSELLDVKARFEQSKTAKSDETDILTSEMERATERASMAERENESLRTQLQDMIAKLQADGGAHGRELDGEIDQLKKTNLVLEISAKEREVAQLVEDVQKQQAMCAKVRAEGESRVSRLEEELAKVGRQCEQAQQKLATQADYEEVKKELGILKSIEFGEDTSADRSSKPLETLLLEKNRALQNEKTALKQTNEELAVRGEKLSIQLSELIAANQEQKSLIGQLEEDLHKVNAVSSVFRGDAEGEPSPIAGLIGESTKETRSDVSAADSLLPIMSSQRERYKAKTVELEGQLLAQQQHLQHQQTEVDKLRGDNVKLYEKIKFLESYKAQMQTTNTAESRYSVEYERRMDPFQSFNKKERQRKYASLKTHEKITLTVGRLLMGNPLARTIAFVYFILLHCLVFMVLYKLAHVDDTYHRSLAVECQQKYADHMMHFHDQEKHNGG